MDLFDKCKEILKERNSQYGDNFKPIADYWNTYLSKYNVKLSTYDVAMMMCLMKIAREGNIHKDDNIVDAINYLYLADKNFKDNFKKELKIILENTKFNIFNTDKDGNIS